MALLPCNTLPCRALSLIREYSKPLTRPDWRKSKPIVTTFYLYNMVQTTPTFLKPLIYNLYMNVSQTRWFELYACIRFNGLSNVFQRYDINPETLMKIDGMQDALTFYLTYKK
jgi:hypothetical protein